MAITHEQFIQLLADKLGLDTEEVSGELNELIEQIQNETAKGNEFTIDKFGTFKVKNGRLSFEVDSTFALEINYKYAGMTPVELKGGKTATVSDEEMSPPEKPEPEEDIPEKESKKSEKPSEEVPEKSESKDEEASEESSKKAPTEPESDWVPGEASTETEKSETGKEKKRDHKSDQERAHIYRSPNRLLNEDELPKRRTGLFVVIVLVLAVLFAGYYLIVQRGGAPAAENMGGVTQGDSVYVQDDNTQPAIRDTKRGDEDDTTANTGEVGMATDSTQLASATTNSGADSAASATKIKKSVTANTVAASPSVAAKDSVTAKNIMNDLTGTSLYGLHGKASNDIGDYYTIVIASLRDQSKARSVGKRWGARNYRVVVAPGQVRGQTWYRVGLGQFSTVSDAENAVKKLPNRLHDNKHHFIRRIHQ